MQGGTGNDELAGNIKKIEVGVPPYDEDDGKLDDMWTNTQTNSSNTDPDYFKIYGTFNEDKRNGIQM